MGLRPFFPVESGNIAAIGRREQKAALLFMPLEKKDCSPNTRGNAAMRKRGHLPKK